MGSWHESPPRPERGRQLAVLIPSLGGGGAERVVVNLVRGFVRAGVDVDLLLVDASGPLLAEIPQSVRVVELKGGRVIASLPGIVRYLRRERPDAVLSHLDTMNLVTLAACRLSRVRTRTVVTTHIALSQHAGEGPMGQRVTARLVRRLYPSADAVVGVSKGVVAGLGQLIGANRARIVTIYNPIVPDAPDISDPAGIGEDPESRPLALPGKCCRMILSVGRLTRQKNHALLIEAAVRVFSRDGDLCLVILGDGPERARLEALVAEYGLSERVFLPGFVRDPEPYYRAASLFVLSSRWEGLPTVLIEALWHGCPIVSTRCPSGPEEILEGGRFGRLVTPGNADELAQTIQKALSDPTDPDRLRRRARDFGMTRSVREYMEVLFPEASAVSGEVESNR